MKRALLLAACLLLTGCSHTYLERQIYPICLSIDLTDDGRYQLGLQAPQSVSGAQTSYDVISALGDTPMDALRVLAASTPYPLHFSQLRLCLISYHTASTQPLRPLLRQLLELPGMRPNACVMVALGSALETMSAQKPDFGMRLSTHLHLLFERLHREKTLPDSALSYCVRELGDGRSDLLLCICAVNSRLQTDQPAAEPGSPGDAGGSVGAFSVGEPWSDALLPEELLAGMLPRQGSNPVEYLGAATVSDGRVSGLLSARETQLALRLLDEASISVHNGQLQITLNSDTDPAQVQALVSRLQALGCDALRFGCQASMAFAWDEEWEQADFRSRYPTMALVLSHR